MLEVLGGTHPVLRHHLFHLLRALREVDGHEAAELVGGAAHCAQQLRTAGVGAVGGERDPDAVVLGAVVALVRGERFVEAPDLGARLPVGDPPLREPEIGGGEHVQGAVEAQSQLHRGVEGLARARPEHLDQGGAAALDDLHHPELHHRAHLAVGEGLHREGAERHQDAVDELLGGVFGGAVLGQSPSQQR